MLHFECYKVGLILLLNQYSFQPFDTVLVLETLNLTLQSVDSGLDALEKTFDEKNIRKFFCKNKEGGYGDIATHLGPLGLETGT